MISDFIKKLQEKTDLTYDEMNNVMTNILSGNTNNQENADFLSNLAEKGETDDELLGMLDKMQELSLKIEPKNAETIIDMCGTGGDQLQTFNVSTTASFVVAAAGGIVAKHGNRSTSGVSGSADIFEYFGYDLNQEPSKIVQVLEKHKICFMFAQKFHPAMKHVSEARKQLGKRTAFNLLGPLSNPAKVKNQLIGVFSSSVIFLVPAIGNVSTLSSVILTNISGDAPMIVFVSCFRWYMYGDGFNFRNVLYKVRLSPLFSNENFLDSTTWKISPSWINFFAVFTISENFCSSMFGVTSLE